MNGVLLWCLPALLAVSSVAAALAVDEDYIKVEIRGELTTDVVAIGGESTGTLIRAGNVTWELDLGGNAMLQKLAKELNKKTVLVTGAYTQKKGVEIPVRHIVKVEMLKAAK
jgi:hypothetical protein